MSRANKVKTDKQKTVLQGDANVCLMHLASGKQKSGQEGMSRDFYKASRNFLGGNQDPRRRLWGGRRGGDEVTIVLVKADPP